MILFTLAFVAVCVIAIYAIFRWNDAEFESNSWNEWYKRAIIQCDAIADEYTSQLNREIDKHNTFCNELIELLDDADADTAFYEVNATDMFMELQASQMQFFGAHNEVERLTAELEKANSSFDKRDKYWNEKYAELTKLLDDADAEHAKDYAHAWKCFDKLSHTNSMIQSEYDNLFKSYEAAKTELSKALERCQIFQDKANSLELQLEKAHSDIRKYVVRPKCPKCHRFLKDGVCSNAKCKEDAEPIPVDAPETFDSTQAAEYMKLYQVVAGSRKMIEKPMLADAKVNDLVKLVNGSYEQLERRETIKTIDYVVLRGCYYSLDGKQMNRASGGSRDIISTEPLAPKGTAEWAWQMMLLGKKVTIPAIKGDWFHSITNGVSTITDADVPHPKKRTKEHWMRDMEKTGWQLWEEK